MTKETEQKYLDEASNYLPQPIDKLFPKDVDKVDVIIDDFEVDHAENIATLKISGKDYTTASKYLITALDYLSSHDVKIPFKATIIRKDSKDGYVYYDMK